MQNYSNIFSVSYYIVYIYNIYGKTYNFLIIATVGEDGRLDIVSMRIYFSADKKRMSLRRYKAISI